MSTAQAQPSTLPGSPSPTTADIVVGVATYNDDDRIGQALDEIVTACRQFDGNATCAIVHTHADGTNGARAVGATPVEITHIPYPLGAADKAPGPYLGVPAKGSAVRTVFAEAKRRGAKVCAIVDADLDRFTPGWLDALVRPVLTRDIDFVAPYYARHKFAGAINNGVAYPLARTLFGKRVRFPLGGDFACSQGFLERCLAETPWDTDPVRTLPDLWLAMRAMSNGSRVGQAMLGAKRQIWRDPGSNAAAPLAKVLSTLFTATDRWQSVWQKVRGSEAVSVSGALNGADDGLVTVDAREGMEAFRLAQKNLDEVWRLVLPPGTLLELKKLALMGAEAFRLPDPVWARCVFDFSLAYHQRTLGREHVLNAFAPLFSAWVSSFVLEMEDATPAEFEERIDHLCLRFESEKPYLISRWRWPDRFSP